MAPETVYFLYERPKKPEENPDGRRPRQNSSSPCIQISISYARLYDTSESIPLGDLADFKTERNPREIIIGLQKLIRGKKGLVPGLHGGFEETDEDKEEYNREIRGNMLGKYDCMHIDYFPCELSPKKTKLTPEEEQRLFEMDNIIYPIFIDYIKQLKIDAKNGNGHSNGSANGKNGHTTGKVKISAEQ